MAEFTPIKSSQAELKDKVVIVSGGASGIGASTVTQLHNAGAHVYFGDVSASSGHSLASNLTASSGTSPSQSGTATFIRTDVSSYADLYRLFRTAFDKHGRIDHAIGCAGILERGKWFDPELDIESVSKPDDEARAVLEVNLWGTCAFARIAVVFLRGSQDQSDKSLTLVASVASIRESAGLFMYQTSKTGILGLLRSMRTPIFKRDGVRTNIVCPGMTESAMTTSFIGKFRERGLATQTSEDVANVILGVVTQREAIFDIGTEASVREIPQATVMNGTALYVEGGRAFEFENSQWATMPDWLGADATSMLRTNAAFVASGALLRKD